jgi:hypothetical protein
VVKSEVVVAGEWGCVSDDASRAAGAAFSSHDASGACAPAASGACAPADANSGCEWDHVPADAGRAAPLQRSLLYAALRPARAGSRSSRPRAGPRCSGVAGLWRQRRPRSESHFRMRAGPRPASLSAGHGSRPRAGAPADALERGSRATLQLTRAAGRAPVRVPVQPRGSRPERDRTSDSRKARRHADPAQSKGKAVAPERAAFQRVQGPTGCKGTAFQPADGTAFQPASGAAFQERAPAAADAERGAPAGCRRGRAPALPLSPPPPV